jgi:hypothetical protein
MRNEEISRRMLVAAVFLLPWQMRWIFEQLTLNGEAFEYGKLSLYAVQVLIVAALAIRGWPPLRPEAGKPLRNGLWFLAACFLSVAFSQFFSLAAGLMLHVVGAFVLFWLLLDERIPTRSIVCAFVAGLIIPCVLGWWQVATGTSPTSTLLGLAGHDAATLGDSVVETSTGRILRAYGTLPHPNMFGGYLAAGLILLAWLTRHVHDARERLWLLVPTTLFAATIIVTFSRSAWLAAAAAFAVMFALMLWFRKLPPRRAIPMFGMAVIAITMTLVAFHNPVITRFQPQARLEAKSIAERSGDYLYVDDVIKLNPLTGAGVGNYPVALAIVRPDDPVWTYQPIHNTFLLVFGELGIIGLIALIFWFASIDTVNYRVLSTANGMFGAALGTVLLVVALLDHYPWSLWPGLALMAVCFALILRWSMEATDTF